MDDRDTGFLIARVLSESNFLQVVSQKMIDSDRSGQTLNRSNIRQPKPGRSFGEAHVRNHTKVFTAQILLLVQTVARQRGAGSDEAIGCWYRSLQDNRRSRTDGSSKNHAHPFGLKR